MAQYLAVFKKNKGDTPSKTTFLADDVKTAMAKLCVVANVNSTVMLYEYEILEIVGAGGYKPAASKIGDVKVLAPPPILEEDEIEELESPSLPTYTPYTRFMV